LENKGSEEVGISNTKKRKESARGREGSTRKRAQPRRQKSWLMQGRS